MRMYLEPIRAEGDPRRPRRFVWRKHILDVREILERWISQTQWWNQEERRVYMRVLTGEGIVEVYRSGERWTLSRIMD